MRDLITTQNITLDGVIDNDSSWFDPADPDGAFTDVNEARIAQARASTTYWLTRLRQRGPGRVIVRGE